MLVIACSRLLVRACALVHTERNGTGIYSGVTQTTRVGREHMAPFIKYFELEAASRNPFSTLFSE